MTSAADALKLFFLSNQLTEHELDRVEAEYTLDLRRGHVRSVQVDADYYPQLEQSLRSQAAAMAPHYETFFALENSIRAVVAGSLEGEVGDGWWDSGRVPSQ